MRRSGKYVINFGSLGDNAEEFEFEVTDSFFDQYEDSIVRKGKIDVLVTVEKKQNMLLLDFTMDGVITVQCDRCLEELNLDVSSYNETLSVKFGEERGEESEDVIILSAKDNELDVAQYIYEYINVLVPMRNVHPEDEDGNSTCNPEALKAIEKYRIHEEEKPADPRWEGLKGINLN